MTSQVETRQQLLANVKCHGSLCISLSNRKLQNAQVQSLVGLVVLPNFLLQHGSIPWHTDTLVDPSVNQHAATCAEI